MIVRVMGEGQFDVADELQTRLNEIDTHAAAAVEQGDEAELSKRLAELAKLVMDEGTPLPLESLEPSDLIVPPSDLTLDEARELFSGEGLIPDLPVQS